MAGQAHSVEENELHADCTTAMKKTGTRVFTGPWEWAILGSKQHPTDIGNPRKQGPVSLQRPSLGVLELFWSVNECS
jgi:hypothetical protein